MRVRWAEPPRVLALLLVILGAPVSAASQTARPRRVPVTLVLVDTTAATSEPFRIVRRANADPHDVIFLSRRADEGTLSEAVEELLVLRSVQGDTVRSDGTMRVRHSTSRSQAPTLPWAARVLADLRRADPQMIASIGVHRAITIWLPAQRGRGTPPARKSPAVH